MNDSEKIKTFRNDLGLTQIEFAKKLNICTATIGQVECGKRKIPPILKLAILTKYGIDISKGEEHTDIQKLKEKIGLQEVLIEQLKREKTALQHKVNNFESLQRCKCCDCCEEAIEKYKEVYFELDELKSKIKEVIK